MKHNFVKIDYKYIDTYRILYYTEEYGDINHRRIKVCLEGGVELELSMPLVDFERKCFGKHQGYVGELG